MRASRGARAEEERDEGKGGRHRHKVVGLVLVGRGEDLKEQEDGGEERADHQLHRRALEGDDHQPDEHEPPEHLDELPPEEVRLVAAAHTRDAAA